MRFYPGLEVYIRRPLLIVVIGVFSLLLLFQLAQGVYSIYNKSVSQLIAQSNVTSKVPVGLPVRFLIPEININAKIQHVGVNSQGEMGVPNNTIDVAWFKLGSRPGEKGSSVISGHFDGKNGETGVFTNLYKLKVGDKLYIEDDRGKTTTFVVRESRTYDPGYADEVFSINDSAHLNLVTCDGVWDGTKKSYSKRLVVFADAS
ncbi:MAG: class F sortase [Candidatus Daviesbacteria bacterium]|nr:class F sortase [Candidatus Daviesbacteria bacterium]